MLAVVVLSFAVAIGLAAISQWLELRQFTSAFSRYLDDSSITALQAAFQSHFSENSSVTDDASVTDRKSPKSAPHNGCNGVTD